MGRDSLHGLHKPEVIAFSNQKGGVGKTTSAVSLSAVFAEMGFSVYLVDADPQCNATTGLGVNPRELYEAGGGTIADIVLNGEAVDQVAVEFEGRFAGRIRLIPGNKDFAGTEKVVELAVDHQRKTATMLQKLTDDQLQLVEAQMRTLYHQRLRQALVSLDDADLVLIDCPPSLSFPMAVSLSSADWYIVPTGASKYDLDGLAELMATIDDIREGYNPELKLLGVLRTRWRNRVSLYTEVKNVLDEHFDDGDIFESSVRLLNAHEEAPYQEKTIVEFSGSHDAAKEYRLVAEEILERIQSKRASPETALEVGNG